MSIKERRGGERISTDLAVRWSTAVSSTDSRIVDLSHKGCFILTANKMPTNKVSRVKQDPGNEAIQVELRLSAHKWLKVDGEVVYKVERTGFAVRFLSLNPDEEKVLKAFISEREAERPKSLVFPRVGRGRKH